MHWILAPLLALVALARHAGASSSVNGWTRLDAVEASAPSSRSWGAAADALRAQLKSSNQVAVSDGVLMLRREWSSDGKHEMHVLYKRI